MKAPSSGIPHQTLLLDKGYSSLIISADRKWNGLFPFAVLFIVVSVMCLVQRLFTALYDGYLPKFCKYPPLKQVLYSKFFH